MRISVICTLGPASRDPDVITNRDARGVDLFRINLSHTALEAVETTIDFIRRYSSVPICLDTEGAQVRCGPVVPDLVLGDGAEIELVTEPVLGSADRLTLTPHHAFAALRPGSALSVDFHGAVLRVVEVHSGGVRAVVERGGRIGSNKAVTVDPPPDLPPLTEKDVAAIAIGCR